LQMWKKMGNFKGGEGGYAVLL